MELYVPFAELVTRTRAEARLSTNPAVGSDANTRYKQVINRVYKTLFHNYDWPHLKYVAPRITLNAGQRYYDFPAALDHTTIRNVVVWWNGDPLPIDPGIGFDQYGSYDSERNERADPVIRYDLRSTDDGTTQIEVWPLPESSIQQMEITGRRKWRKLVNPADICLIDADLVATFSAAEIMRPINADDADQKAAAGATLLNQFRARSVLPQSDGSTAPNIGNSQVRVGLTNNRATVRVGRSDGGS